MYSSKATGGDWFTLIRRTGRGIAIAGVLALAMASGAMAEEPEGVTTGPGAVFDSPNAAAIDALMHAHRTMALAPGQGGAIFAKDGGFSYGPTVRSTARDGFQLKLRPGDVGWYYAHNYELPTFRDRERRVPTRENRSMVSEVDPYHRPLYLLTRRMKVVRYDGRSVDLVLAEGEDQDHVIAAN